MSGLATRSGLEWGRRPIVRALPVMLAALLICNVIAIALRWSGHIGHGWPDFFALWSAAKFLRLHAASGLYDMLGFHRFQDGWGMGVQNQPFLYPPSALPMYWPLGLFSYRAAFAAWLAIGLGAHIASLLGKDRRLWGLTVLAALAAPATAVCAAAGQLGLLIAGLLIGGLRLAESRPLLGGLLLGLATVKPQFCVLLLPALIAARLWRALFAAAATAIALVLLSAALFGPGAWTAWLGALPRAAAMLGSLPVLDKAMPTVTGNLRLLGAGPAVALAAQLLAGAAAGCVVWHAFRHRGGSGAVAALLAGAFLCTPYALWFDLPLLSGAVILLVQERLSADGRWTAQAILILGAGFFLPTLMADFAPFPLSAGVPALVAILAAGGSEPRRSERALCEAAGCDP